MHILLGLAALFGAAMLWYWRFKMAREAAGELVDAANDVRLAARRFAYTRKHKSHPIDCIDDPRLAAAGIALAIAQIDQPLSRNELDAMAAGAREIFEVGESEAADITSFGRWIAGQANTPEEAVRRLVRVVKDRAGPESGPDLMRLVERVAIADGGEPAEREKEAMSRLAQALSAA